MRAIWHCVGSVVGYADSDAGEGSHLYFSARARNENTKRVDCLACDGSFPYFDTYEAPCAHSYCRGCIRELFSGAIKDETLYPPRCCRQNMAVEKVKPVLGKDLAKRFEEKAVEWDTLYRVYCPVQTCSAFIPPDSGSVYSNRATCPKCAEPVCTQCKRYVKSIHTIWFQSAAARIWPRGRSASNAKP